MINISDWTMLQGIAATIVKARLVDLPYDTVLAILIKGREIGFEPLQSLAQIYVLKNKLCLHADGQLALIRKAYPETKLTFVQNDDKACTVKVSRGSEENTFSFTWDDAIKAQLTGGLQWKKYPRAMLRSRVISEMARAMFPDALMGFKYNIDEVRDMQEKPNESKPKPEPEQLNIDAAYNPETAGHKEYLMAIIKGVGVSDHDEMRNIHELMIADKVALKDIKPRLKRRAIEG